MAINREMRPPPLRPIITGLALPRRLSSFAIALVIAAVAATASPHAGDHVRQVLIRPTVDAETVRCARWHLLHAREGHRAAWKTACGARSISATGWVAVAAYDGVTSCVYSTMRTIAGGHSLRCRCGQTASFGRSIGAARGDARGLGEPGLKDGTGAGAEFYNPSAVAVGPLGELHVADS